MKLLILSKLFAKSVAPILALASVIVPQGLPAHAGLMSSTLDAQTLAPASTPDLSLPRTSDNIVYADESIVSPQDSSNTPNLSFVS